MAVQVAGLEPVAVDDRDGTYASAGEIGTHRHAQSAGADDEHAARSEPALTGLADIGQDIPPRDKQTPQALGDHHMAEIEKWWPIIKTAGIKAQ